jgi:acetyl esterase/lipase
MRNFIITLVLFLVTSCGFNTAVAQVIVPDFVNVEYANADGIGLLLDIYLPKNIPKPYPVIVWIHGGAWMSGSKDSPTAGFMVNQKYSVVSINYRLSQQAKFPAQIHDCKSAIRWVRSHAAQYGFNVNRIGVWGSSAGGHLSALVGTSGGVDSLEGTVGGNLQYSSRVQAVCDWFGPSDFLTIGDFPSSLDHNAPNSPEAQLIDGAIKENLDKARAASPIYYVTRDDPPFLIMHGTADMTVPFHQSVELDSALRLTGVSVILKPLPGAGHGGSAFTADSSRRLIIEFFDRYLKVPASSVDDKPEESMEFRLEQNYPNPLNPATTIRFSLGKPSQVILKVYDMIGREIRTLLDGEMDEGEHSVMLVANDLASGAYFYALKSRESTRIRKLTLCK